MDKVVSIVIPVYKVEQYLAECVDSVINQTYKNIECIIVDDGSPDSCGEIADRYALENTNVIVCHQCNAGLSAARNAGLDLASGQYVYFLDSDDYLSRNAVELLVREAEREDADVTIFDGDSFNDDGSICKNEHYYNRSKKYETTDGIKQLQMLYANGEYRAAVPFALYKREYLINHKIRFINGILHEDVPFSYLVYTSNGRIAHCHECLYHRRFRGESIQTSTDNTFNKCRSLLVIFKDLLSIGVYDETKPYLSDLSQMIISRYRKLNNREKKELLLEYREFIFQLKEQLYFDDNELRIKAANRFIQPWIRRFYNTMK